MEQFDENSAKKSNEVVINSGPRLTIETTAAFAERIRNELAGAELVVIEFDPEIEMDITALQVLCSACTTATNQGKRFLHRGPAPRALVALAKAAGSERHDPCKNSNEFCFRQFEGVRTWLS